MARAVGLDIGSHSIKVVELSGSPRAFKVVRVAVRDLPPAPAPGSPEAEGHDPQRVRADAVKEALASLRLGGDNICATYDSGTTLSREQPVPFAEPEKIRKVVKFEAEHHLHSQSVDEVVVNWIKTGETKEGSRITIFASSKQELVQRLAVMRMAGVEPASIDLDATASYTCAEALGLFAKAPNAILLEVGAHTTALMLVVDGKPRMVRSWLLDVASLPAMPAGSLGRADAELLVPAAEAEARETEAMVPREAQAEVVKKLHREVIRSLAGLRQDAPPSVVYLCGGGALLPGMPEALAERFGLPVEVLDPVTASGSSPSGMPAGQGARLVGATGAALRMLGHNPLGIELLQDEFAPSNTFEVARTALATLVTLLFLLMLGLNYRLGREVEAARAINARIYKNAAGMFQIAESKYLQQIESKDAATADKAALAFAASQPPDHTRVGNLRARLIARHRKLQGDLGLAKDIPEVPSATKVMYEIYKALSQVPREELGDWFAIEKMDISERRCSFTITASESTVFDTVRGLIGKSDYLRGRAKNPQSMLEPQSRQNTKEGYAKQPFVITFKESD